MSMEKRSELVRFSEFSGSWSDQYICGPYLFLSLGPGQFFTFFSRVVFGSRWVLSRTKLDPAKWGGSDSSH